jgi:uncharacterized protein YhbP (UPF0306 family)
MTIERTGRSFSPAHLIELTGELLDASMLCAIATVSSGGHAYVSTAYFAWSDKFDLVWLSEPRATHSRNLRFRSATAVSVYDSTQSWSDPDRGIQLFGAAREVVGAAAREAAHIYANRFPDYRGLESGDYHFYLFRPNRLKLTNEQALGSGVFVTARVRGGRLSWLRTEVYRGGPGP